MARWLELVATLLLGVTLGAGVMAWAASRARRAMVSQLSDRLAPMLERRAALLGVKEGTAPAVAVGADGELVLHDTDTLARVLRLADLIESHEQGQLGYLDTVRVSKDDVDDRLARQRK